jgi:hypothetical protein
MAIDITIDGTVVGNIEPSALTGERQRAENIMRASQKAVEFTAVVALADGETQNARLARIVTALATALGDVTLSDSISQRFRRDYGVLYLADVVDPDAVVPDWDGRTYKELPYLRTAGKLRFGRAPGGAFIRFLGADDSVLSLPEPPNFDYVPRRGRIAEV